MTSLFDTHTQRHLSFGNEKERNTVEAVDYLDDGCLIPITFHIPEGCLLDPSTEAAVVGGNVLTSQRVVDVVKKHALPKNNLSRILTAYH